MRLENGLTDRLEVEWTERSEVDDFGADSDGFKLLGGLESKLDTSRVRDDSHVISRSLDFGLSDWQDELV